MQIRPYDRSDSKSDFSCGDPDLDRFLGERAHSHEKGHVSRVYVLEHPESPGVVLGFYTLSAGSIERERLRPFLSGSLPRYPLPVFYIGNFAISKSRQRQGLGRMLMGDALLRCAEGSKLIGAVGVYLDSRDERSTAFYRGLGFVEIARASSVAADSPQPMFLPMKTLLGALPPRA